tara:strand:- start:596 stop:919 length:324 start_codon:yes stop_codon:yes gene_type:complete
MYLIPLVDNQSSFLSKYINQVAEIKEAMRLRKRATKLIHDFFLRSFATNTFPIANEESVHHSAYDLSSYSVKLISSQYTWFGCQVGIGGVSLDSTLFLKIRSTSYEV